MFPGSDSASAHPHVSQSHSSQRDLIEKKMCPLRLILIFLSATLAGFFVLRNLRSQPHVEDNDDVDVDIDAAPHPQTSDSSNPSSNGNSKVRAALESGFWTFVDMASGRYLWRNMVSSSSKRSSWCDKWLYVIVNLPLFNFMI